MSVLVNRPRRHGKTTERIAELTRERDTLAMLADDEMRSIYDGDNEHYTEADLEAWDRRIDELRPAYVTYAGDLACSICGQRADRDFEEEASDLDFGFFEDVMGDSDEASDEDEDDDERREAYVARRIREHEEADITTYAVGDFYEEYDTGDLRAPRIAAPGAPDDRPSLDDIDLPF